MNREWVVFGKLVGAVAFGLMLGVGYVFALDVLTATMFPVLSGEDGLRDFIMYRVWRP